MTFAVVTLFFAVLHLQHWSSKLSDNLLTYLIMAGSTCDRWVSESLLNIVWPMIHSFKHSISIQNALELVKVNITFIVMYIIGYFYSSRHQIVRWISYCKVHEPTDTFNHLSSIDLSSLIYLSCIMYLSSITIISII